MNTLKKKERNTYQEFSSLVLFNKERNALRVFVPKKIQSFFIDKAKLQWQIQKRTQLSLTKERERERVISMDRGEK
jgi:hypothetical protein